MTFLGVVFGFNKEKKMTEIMGYREWGELNGSVDGVNLRDEWAESLGFTVGNSCDFLL